MGSARVKIVGWALFFYSLFQILLFLLTFAFHKDPDWISLFKMMNNLIIFSSAFQLNIAVKKDNMTIVNVSEIMLISTLVGFVLYTIILLIMFIKENRYGLPFVVFLLQRTLFFLLIFIALQTIRPYRKFRERIQKNAVWPNRLDDFETEDENNKTGPEAMRKPQSGWTRVDGDIGQRYIYNPPAPIPVPQTFDICNQWPNFVPPNFYPPPLARTEDGEPYGGSERNLAAYPRPPAPPMIPQGYSPIESPAMGPASYLAGPPFPNQYGTPDRPACWIKCNQY
ncbi:uncharacterized protein LOC106667894 isoform X2 [Cimex lectularius]|uniref:Uncharacterized protein n=1 Tax=Cimex lectularius TaxID=79782 RepID=A0A8I6RSC3_CIMLE|nr:uncharacterized protein LOC106667894 isoform X2 [Cimex lectularius]